MKHAVIVTKGSISSLGFGGKYIMVTEGIAIFTTSQWSPKDEFIFIVIGTQ